MAQTIDAFLTQWCAAERSGDPAALDALLTDDFLGVGPLGFTLPKAAWLARRDQGLAYQDFALEETTVRRHGEVALVTTRQRVRGTHQGNPIPEAMRATLSVAGEGGRWRLAGIHLSFIGGTAGAPPVPVSAPPVTGGARQVPERRDR
ncbi:MAG TPA: nuclear transport factor 2 family protein [Actinomycetota bacterium]|nr:nuclear transport factor 2 family protein [Actinomycetota bacterium]